MYLHAGAWENWVKKLNSPPPPSLLSKNQKSSLKVENFRNQKLPKKSFIKQLLFRFFFKDANNVTVLKYFSFFDHHDLWMQFCAIYIVMKTGGGREQLFYLDFWGRFMRVRSMNCLSLLGIIHSDISCAKRGYCDLEQGVTHLTRMASPCC